MPDEIEETRTKLGLNRPIPEQLGIYYVNLLQGDLGHSYFLGMDVGSILFSKLPKTLLLTVTAFLLALPLGVLLGVIAAKNHNGRIDVVISSGSVTAYSVPTFWLGLMALLIFGVKWNLVPIQGMVSVDIKPGDPNYLLDLLQHLVLPAVVLAIPNVALFSRIMRASMIEVIKQDYITLARSKGCTEQAIYFKHALRNALLSVVTLAGVSIRKLVMGSALVEVVFSWPGMGRLMYESVLERDYPLLSGGLLVFSLVQMISSVVVDVSYTLLDPRIRY